MKNRGKESGDLNGHQQNQKKGVWKMLFNNKKYKKIVLEKKCRKYDEMHIGMIFFSLLKFLMDWWVQLPTCTQYHQISKDNPQKKIKWMLISIVHVYTGLYERIWLMWLPYHWNCTVLYTHSELNKMTGKYLNHSSRYLAMSLQMSKNFFFQKMQGISRTCHLNPVLNRTVIVSLLQRQKTLSVYGQ